MLAMWEFSWGWPNSPLPWPTNLMILNSAVLKRTRGVTWNVDRNENWSTLSHQASNGKYFRSPYWKAPLWDFVYRWGYLRDQPNNILQGNAYTDLRQLWGQILPLNGMAFDFLYQPDDSVVIGQPLTLVTDPTSPSFKNAEIVHNVGGYLESVQYLTGLNVYFDGDLQDTSSLTIAPPGTVPDTLGWTIQLITGTPVVTVDFTYFYPCMLSEDSRSYSEFMYQLWEFKELKFKQVRL